jgi:undecaprenyl-diphosphatase
MQLINLLSDLDHRLFLRFAGFCQRSAMTNGAKIVSKTGDGYLQVLLPFTVLLADPTYGWSFFKLAALAFLLERSTYWVLKNTLRRRRPPVAIPSFRAVINASDEFSFPSGHTCGAFLLATLFFFYSAPIGLALYLWATIVGCSRVALGVHFPADILAGATLGSGIGIIVLHIV